MISESINDSVSNLSHILDTSQMNYTVALAGAIPDGVVCFFV